MTIKNNTELFEKLLVSFCQEDDPMKEMLQWMTNQLMGLLQNVSGKDFEPKKPEFTERK